MMNRALPSALAEVHVGADALISHNLHDFPTAACESFGVEALGADEFLARQARRDPTAITDAFAEMARRRSRPPKTVGEIVDRLVPSRQHQPSRPSFAACQECESTDVSPSVPRRAAPSIDANPSYAVPPRQSAQNRSDWPSPLPLSGLHRGLCCWVHGPLVVSAAASYCSLRL